MATSFNPHKAYRETQIKTAGQGKLIIMLYDEAIRQIDIATRSMGESSPHYDTINSALLKAQDLITELMVSLDFERGGEIAQGLFSLYMFFNQQLIEANIKKEKKPLEQIRQMLAELRITWVQISARPDLVETEHEPRGVNIAG